MKLKHAGFFKEFHYLGDCEISILSFISTEQSIYKPQIINYLKNGFDYIVFLGGASRDIIDPFNKKLPYSNSILTDGIWAWPNVLAYYVQQYNLALDEEFVAHMSKSNWLVPAKDTINLEALEL